MSDIRVTPGAPVVGNFADRNNTPIVIDNSTGAEAVFGLFCDIHFQSDGLLTNERNRTFTKKRGMF